MPVSCLSDHDRVAANNPSTFARTFSIRMDPNFALLLSRIGQGCSPIARVFLTLPPTGRYFYTPYPPIASQSISRDVPRARARAFRFATLCPQGEPPDCPLLRASNEHILIVRVLRARRMVWRLPSHTSEAARCVSTGEHLALLASLLRQWDRPRPLPFGQRHFLKSAVRPLKLTNLIDLHYEGVCFMCQTSEPIPASRCGFPLGPSIIDHTSVTVSPRSRV
jgi:hypothetical protein